MGLPRATPKARLFQIYPLGKGLTFVTESVPTPPSEDAVPGSTSYFKPNHAVTFRCTLSLPDGSQVTSDLFQRKKDAEHNASQRALDQMRVPLAPALDVLSVEEKWENLRRRILETFSDKNVLSYMPLREHFKMAVKRKGHRYGQVPIAAVVALDAKINTLCKVINRKAEGDPVYAVALLCKAASQCSSVKLDFLNLCISRIERFKPEVEQDLLERKQELCAEGSESEGRQERANKGLCFRAVHIPSSADKAVCSSQIVVQQEEYYLDVLARRIGLKDGSRLAMSRPIGKSHPATRLYWAVPNHLPRVDSNTQSDFAKLAGEGPANTALDHEDLRKYSTKQQDSQTNHQDKNVRASLLMGYPVYGDVVLAAVGGDWRSVEVYSLDVSLSFYYRALLGRFPQGNYKVSRGALVTSNLPLSFSSRLQWKGMSPRGLLIEFCQQHRLPEPAFVLSYPGSESHSHSDLDGKIPELAEMTELDEGHSIKLGEIENEGAPENLCSKNEDENHTDDNHTTPLHCGPFMCTVRVEFQKGSVIEFESGGPYRNRHDAIQSSALQAVHSCRPWFESCLSGSYEPIMPQRANSDIDGNLSRVVHDEVVMDGMDCSWDPSDKALFELEPAVDSSQIDQTPPPGAMVTIRYTVRWFNDADQMSNLSNVLLEKKDEFMFELGIDGVVGGLEPIVAEMSVGQTACFFAPPLATLLLFAASDDLSGKDGLLSPEKGKIKFTVQLLKYAEAPEERMEAALFKPSLSKQRLGCALSIIQNLQAKSLIDLGCGSGSLMENLLEEPTGLVELVGVDISPKSLVRAAKVLSTKLMEDQPGKEKLDTIKLYEGSIADFNPQMQGVDVAVCIEVVEHMDPEPLSMFGSTILGKLQPRVLIVSTPNFEYNPILQGLDWDPSTNSLTGGGQVIANTLEERVPLGINSDKALEQKVRFGSNSDTAVEERELLGSNLDTALEERVGLGSNLDTALEERVRTGSNSDIALGSMEKRIRLSDGKDAGPLNGSRKSKIAQQVKFRNEDHRFEWTRAEFRDWALTMAKNHQYGVSFDGVGGSGEDEGPGYASQIAIFTRSVALMELQGTNGGSKQSEGESSPHKIVWQWMPVEQQNK